MSIEADSSIPKGRKLNVHQLKIISDDPSDYIKSGKPLLLMSESEIDGGENAIVWGPFTVKYLDERDVNFGTCWDDLSGFACQGAGTVCMALQPEGETEWFSHDSSAQPMKVKGNSDRCDNVIEVHSQKAGDDNVLDMQFVSLTPKRDHIGITDDSRMVAVTKTDDDSVPTSSLYKWKLVEEIPTEEPTAEPTAEPTTEPTTEPTAEPTGVPTSEPSYIPTVEPTTIEPTPTARPPPIPTTLVPMAPPTPTTQPPSPTTEGHSASEDSLSTGARVGVAVGAVAVLAALGIVGMMMAKRRRARNSTPTGEQATELFAVPPASAAAGPETAVVLQASEGASSSVSAAAAEDMGDL